MKADGIEYEPADGAARGRSPTRSRWPSCWRPRTSCTGAGTRGWPTTSCDPKSVVRDMYERAMTFVEYVDFYGLSRSEGLVLRYLADAYKALRQTVPEDARTEELVDLIEWLGELVRQVDSSLHRRVGAAAQPDADGSRRATVDDRAAGGHRQPARVPGAGAQRAVPPGGAGRPAPLRRAGRAGRRGRLGRRRLGRRARALLRRARRDRHRPGRARPGDAPASTRRPDRLGGPPDLRRPGRRPRLGHHAPRSTWPSPTRPARPSSASSRSASCRAAAGLRRCGMLLSQCQAIGPLR